MHLYNFIFTSLVTVQVYYLYKFIYSIPLRYTIPESENDYVEIGTLLRGLNYTSHGTHKRKHLRQPHQEQTRNDNNTALTYIPSTSPGVVGRF